MTNTTLPVATQASAEVLSHAASSHNSTFKILYFGIQGRGELARNLLAYGDVKWEELAVVSDPLAPISLPHLIVIIHYPQPSDSTRWGTCAV